MWKFWSITGCLGEIIFFCLSPYISAQNLLRALHYQLNERVSGHPFPASGSQCQHWPNQGNISSTLLHSADFLRPQLISWSTHCIPSWTSLCVHSILETSTASSIQYHVGHCILLHSRLYSAFWPCILFLRQKHALGGLWVCCVHFKVVNRFWFFII